MFSSLPPVRMMLALLLAVQLLPAASSSHADVVINEVVTGASDRLLQWDSSGAPRIGAGTPWQAIAFNDASWRNGAGPLGFGTFSGTAPTINTNVSSQLLNLTPTLYLRRSFTVSAANAASTAPVVLTMTYNDGFVAYLNGVEIGRQWAGPANGYIYHDQPAYNPTAANTTVNPTTQYTATISVDASKVKLVAGTNVLAIQALNWSVASPNFLVAPTLQLSGVQSLVAPTDVFKYFPGVVEPSGALYDPALLGSGRLNVPWGAVGFDDSAWGSAAAGPMRAGTTGTGTTIPDIIGQTPPIVSIYTRIPFTATAARVADTRPMQLVVDYDDSFVAYLNGVEVTRANVGAANVFTPYTAVANGLHDNGTAVIFPIDPPANLLKVGTNVLSFQVHNVSTSSSDLFLQADLKTNTGVSIVANTAPFKYFAGKQEPAEGTAGNVEESPDGPEADADWIELYNNGTAAVSLAGWTLTDSTKTPTQWAFPASATIPAGGYLIVFCDGLNITAPAAGGFYHTNFKLGAEGEYLGLYNASGQIVQNFLPTLPAASPFHSYGRKADGSYVYFDTPTPGAANADATGTGAAFTAIAADPVFSLAGGFYNSTQTFTLTSATPGAQIRYTLDGSEPTATSTLCPGSLSVGFSEAIRARAFGAGLVPSHTVTNTYLIAQSAVQQTIPALCLTGDEGRTLYRPYGVMAINNNAAGNYSGSLWTALNDPLQYNNPSVNGECLERPAVMELLYAPGTAPAGYGNVKNGFGLRTSGSAYTFPRFILSLQNAASSPNSGTWANDSTQKPSFNLFFRSELGASPFVAPLFPNSPVTSFHDLRFRAGHNDPNPFVLDELQRRLWIDMGQVGSAGILTSLYVNGAYKGIYNLCEHLREDFFQQSYHSTANWDVRQVLDIGSGDGIAFQEMITYLRTHPQDALTNYQAMSTRLDMVNFADYLLLNVYGADQDWPENNYVVSRERSSTGIHRFHVWDAEFSYGNTQGTVTSNSFTNIGVPLVSSTASTDALVRSIRILYTLLKVSPEFRLLFADRIQKHMFNNGALTNDRVYARWSELSNQASPFLSNYTDKVTAWVYGSGSTAPSRRQVLFGYTNPSGTAVAGHFAGENLWPVTVAPAVNQFGGTVASGFKVTLTNLNGIGTLYYTTDGSDPRLPGGAVSGKIYNASAGIVITQTTLLKARVLNTNGEWSPMLAPTYVVSALPALQITELMYHPPLTGTNTVENEFIEIKNAGTTAVDLSGMNFTSGVTYTFPAGTTLAAGAFAVLVKDQAQFAAKYPSVPVAGVFTDSLSNNGETVTLADVTGAAIFSVTYASSSPWPVLPDGYGNSLVPVNPNSNPAPDTAANWRASAALGGSPGADDPTPTTPAVLVNEVLANSVTPQTDMVELYNPTAASADISGWFLSDSATTPKKFQIPAGTVIPPGGYAVFTETDFNATPGAGTSFAFDSNGEQVRLSAADGSGNLTGYSHGFSFGASAPGVSFGRYVNSVGAESFPAQTAQTFGAANAGPLIGPVVITELIYHPTASGDEFAEVRNISRQTIPLYDPANPANTWKLDGVGFTFPAGTTIAPGQIMLVVPLTEAAWRAKYPATPVAVRVFGAYTGKQDNSGEKISLQMPGVPYANATTGATVVPYIDVDYVGYLPTAPWPTAADGSGPSLERLRLQGFGDDPGNWRASPVSGGSPGALPAFAYSTWNSLHFTPAQLADATISGPNADPDGDGIPNLLEYAFGFEPLAGDASSPYTVSLTNDGGTTPYYLTLTYRRSTATSGLTFHGDVSGSLLGAWTLDGAPPNGTATNNGDGTETVSLRDPTPVSGANTRFIRLRVTGN